ncbi:MAG: DUF4432 family protein, partial [Pseudomonadota bacterium]
GAWQELFPNTSGGCSYGEIALPTHGEVATLPWTAMIERDDAAQAQILLEVECRLMPFALSRRMRLARGSRTLTVEGTVRNLSDRALPFLWGHHPALGAPFLDTGCTISAEPGRVVTIDFPAEVNRTIAPGQSREWPIVQRIDGAPADLRNISGPESKVADHAFLTDFRRGWIEVANPRLGLVFGLEWDPAVFRWRVNWRSFGGYAGPPLEGIYAMGIEPWTTSANLAAAIANNEARWLDGGKTLTTVLGATLRPVGAGASR